MNRSALLALLPTLVLVPTLWLALAAPAQADAPNVSLTLEPWSAYDGVDRPYRYIVSMRVEGEGPLEVVADRRLLSFEVRPTEGRRRRVRCRHPQAPRAASRARRLDGETREWREWIDLRMYCWGRALSALERGAQVEVRYGWRRASRNRWIARRPDTRRTREWVGGARPDAFTFPARSEEAGQTTRLPMRSDRVEEGRESDEPEASPIALSLSPRSSRRGSGISFRVSVRAVEGTERVYVRPDAFTFTVRGPTGEHRCRLPRGGGNPPPDLFSRIGTRRGATQLLDASQFCPDETFERPGVYEVVPKLRLPHSGAEWELDAVTGRFSGPPVAMRVTSGDVGYEEQTPRREGEEPDDE